ncbi:MAG: E3 ubiquitin protein ligase [archaeon]|nr:E3 ubiquitin protein ligase [archaeon]
MDGDDYEYDEYNEYGMDSEPIQSDEPEFLQNDEFERKREEQINSFIEFSSLPHDEAELVLINFNWNLDKLMEVWFDSSDKIKIDSGILRSRISKEKTKSAENQRECLICYDDLNTSNKVGLKCGHFFCLSCYKDYLKAKIKEDPLTVLSTNCPQSKCSLIIPSSFFVKVLSDPEDKDILNVFQKYKLKNFTDSNADIKWCPNEKCGQCVRLPGHGMKDITCLCGTVFCFKCLKETHKPCDCEMMETWEKKYSANSEDFKWLTENTKQCPKCGNFIQKNQGCNHMICKCRHEFCWICLGDWGIHGSSWYKCNYQSKGKGYIQTKRDKTKNEMKETERFIKYVAYYENHKNAKEIAKKEFNKVEEQKQKLRDRGIPHQETLFLDDAYNNIINARRFLMSSYVYAYFLKDNTSNTDLFAHSQGILDEQTDALHEILERTFPNLFAIFSNSEFYIQFKDLKEKIINRMSIITNYQTNLINEFESKVSVAVDYSRFK